jgi:hypothetical protein
MTEYERSKDKTLLKAKTYSLVRYISIFKELHNSTISDLEDARSKVFELTNEISDQEEQIEDYITQLDDADEASVEKKIIIINIRKELRTLISEVKIQETCRGREISANKFQNIKNKFIIWSLIIVQIGSMMYLHMLH